MEYVDLRSDTVTQPTPAMREAMAKASVGDDVYGEDPSVNKLQEMSAFMLGKEAGLFVSSGTMGNLSAMLAYCQRGDEVIVGNQSHIYLFEGGGISALGGVHSCQLPNQADGSLALEDIELAIRTNDPHEPITRLIALENTHNRCGGTFQSAEYIQKICAYAHSRNLIVHLDGARLFNAAVACGISARELAAPVDSVTFCLSKGLCAPVGSVICGSTEFITKAHRIRKQLGGGMRQAGILAAAGIIALEQMVHRLGEDHKRAKKLAEGLNNVPGIILDDNTATPNMVFFSISDQATFSTQHFLDTLKRFGVLIGDVGYRRFRMVTHYWISDEGVSQAVEAIRNALAI